MALSSSDAASPVRAPRAASPWAHVVRGESEVVPAAPSSPPAAMMSNPEANDRDGAGGSEGAENRNANGNGNGKRTAWSSSNRPPNGVIEVGPVMGAVSWPALGEATKAGSKMSPSDSIKNAAAAGGEGSSASVSAPVPTVAFVPNHQHMKVNSNNPNPNSNRQKPNKRGGGGGNNNSHGSHANGGPVPPPPPASLETTQHSLTEKPGGHAQEPSPRDMHSGNKNNNNWDHGSSSRGSGFSPHSHGDHHRPFNRRGNNGSGVGPHNGGGRRDPDRGGYMNEWNNNAAHHMPPPPPRGHHLRSQFIRPPPPPPAGAASFIGPPPPVRHFVPPPVGFPEIPSPVFYVQAPPPPFVAAHPVPHAMPPPMLVNAVDYQRASILKQIEYYFSYDNLCKDLFLRKQMDDQGWVPVSLIAGFNRVKQLTNNIPNIINYILDSVQTSELVEVQGEKIRRRGDWMSWLLPPQHGQQGTMSSPHSSAAANIDNIMDRLPSMTLERSSNLSPKGAISSDLASRLGSVKNQSQA